MPNAGPAAALLLLRTAQNTVLSFLLPLIWCLPPGVTRASIIELARSRGYEVLEEPVAVTEAMEVWPRVILRVGLLSVSLVAV